MNARPRLGSEEPAASALGRLLRESGDRQFASGADSELERLLEAVSGASARRAPRSALRLWALAAAAVAALGLIGILEWREHDGAALTFSTNGVRSHGPVVIAADSGRAVDVEFSDGSAFDVEPAARLRVESSSATGARLTLVDGRTVAHVMHRSRSSWSVLAGPFEVQVTGTRFGASWDATNERLSVELYEGSVQVSGGSFTAPISVRAGQRLEAGKGSGDWVLTSLEGPDSPLRRAGVPPPPSASAPPVASGQSSTTDPTTNVAPGSASASRSTAPTLDWPALLGRADFEGIVRQASDFGIERCFSLCAPSDLRMLADSARYLGRYELAERSLLALRKRSPVDGATTAFLLARLEESRDEEKALSWYDKSLGEAPGGAYAAEALAGKMRVLLKRGGPSAAAPAAEQYLERFPDGVHAAKAREILSRVKAPSDRR